MNYKIIGGTVSALLLGASLLVLCFFVGTGAEVRALSVTIILFGASAGWLVGVLVSPYSVRENEVFPKYAAAASAFASGYLISKADGLIDVVLKPEYVFAPLVGFRLVAGLSASIVALIITYIYRTYAR